MSDNEAINKAFMVPTPDERRPEGIIVQPTTKKDINEFIRWRMQVYKNNWTSISLSTYFGEDFESFNSTMFNTASRDIIWNRRDSFREREHRRTKGRGTHMADALVAAIKEELPWPSDDGDKPELRPVASVPVQPIALVPARRTVSTPI